MAQSTIQIDELAAYIMDALAKQTPNVRYFLGITGNPASGKSILAHELATTVNRRVHGDSSRGAHGRVSSPERSIARARAIPVEGYPCYLRCGGLYPVATKTTRQPLPEGWCSGVRSCATRSCVR